MLREKARKSQKSNTLTVAFTGICFLLVLKIIRGFAVKSPREHDFDTATH